MLYQNHTLNLKSHDEKGFFKGYASVFDAEDAHHDVVLPGAFSKSLKKKNPKMLWQHNSEKPIGFWTRVEEDQNGLWVEGQILLDLKQGREAYILLKEGVVDGLSIGFYIQESTRENQKRFLHHLDLQEISLVTFAAQSQARVYCLKTLGVLERIKNITKVLKTI